MKEFIRIENLSYIYKNPFRKKVALENINLSISKGEFVSVIGMNGSGKSTLAKHLNALLLPSSGKVFIDGFDTSQEENLQSIRKNVGMIFQNPENAIVSAIVEEDIAFGLENLGVEAVEISSRVDKALIELGMINYKKSFTNKLSGGEKQQLAIAGVIVMQPEVIVLDEPTTRLDPNGREKILSIIERFHRNGTTIIYITHSMAEAMMAQRILLMEHGKIIKDGAPHEVLTDVNELRRLGFKPPVVVELAEKLRAKNLKIPLKILSNKDLVNALKKLNDHR